MEDSTQGWSQLELFFPKMSGYFHKLFSSYRKMKVELNLSNNAAKSELKKQWVLMHHHLQKKFIQLL